MFARSFLAVAILAFTVLCHFAKAGDLPTPEKLKRQLEAFDAIFDAGISFRGDLTVTPSDLDVGQPVVKYHFAFTNQGVRHAFFRDADRLPPPSGPSGQGEQGDTATVERTEMVYFDDKFSASFMKWGIFKLKDGKASFLDDTNAVTLEPQDSATLTLPYKSVSWSSGHGFSKYLKRVTSVSQQPGSQLWTIVAEGFECDVNPGTWELTIDPEAAFLVRKATFRNLGGGLTLQMSNSGLKEVDGFPFPETAHMAFSGAGSQELRFASSELKVDEELLAEAKAAVENQRLPNTLFVDSRSGSTTMGHVNPQGQYRKHEYRDEPKPQVAVLPSATTQRWTLIFLNVVAFGSLGLLWGVGRWKQRSGAR